MGRRKTIVAVLAAALLLAPLAVWASDRFEDVPDDNIFHEDIGWMADNGVTFGCNPPANTRFCPSDNVTREQMSAFMRRLSEGQVVDAATALEAAHAATADDADTLDGVDSTGFVQQDEPDSVSSDMTSNEPGFATAADPGTTILDGTVQELLSVTIDAPSDGYVVVNATAEGQMSHTVGTRDQARWGIAQTNTGFDQGNAIPVFANTANAGAGLWQYLLADQQVYAVTEGSSTTFYLIAEELLGDTRIDDPTLTAVFYATAYGGVDLTTADTDAAPSDGEE